MICPEKTPLEEKIVFERKIWNQMGELVKRLWEVFVVANLNQLMVWGPVVWDSKGTLK